MFQIPSILVSLGAYPNPNPKATVDRRVKVGLSLGLGLGLAWGHFQDKKFYIYTSFKDFSLHGYNQTHVLHLVSSSQPLSFSQELTLTLTLGLSLGLGLGLAWGHF